MAKHDETSLAILARRRHGLLTNEAHESRSIRGAQSIHKGRVRRVERCSLLAAICISDLYIANLVIAVVLIVVIIVVERKRCLEQIGGEIAAFGVASSQSQRHASQQPHGAIDDEIGSVQGRRRNQQQTTMPRTRAAAAIADTSVTITSRSAVLRGSSIIAVLDVDALIPIQRSKQAGDAPPPQRERGDGRRVRVQQCGVHGGQLGAHNDLEQNGQRALGRRARV